MKRTDRKVKIEESAETSDPDALWAKVGGRSS